ncbi:hypothetical protein BD310DRAFT_286106 [Dichomitus squalens]|uniref:Uncharacterized protein n=1 Tax=Dichomitus squalens TaxID=114155 RepID=A0A4Q9QAT9_9APHY|nr:hypothetical protein BD310DRAFT_286106 [Dichomitus squalens]
MRMRTRRTYHCYPHSPSLPYSRSPSVAYVLCSPCFAFPLLVSSLSFTVPVLISSNRCRSPMRHFLAESMRKS